MNADETIAKLRLIGLDGRRSTTGHRDYVRVFVLKGRVTVGRFTIFKGEYTHSKWYVGGAGFSGETLHEDERDPLRWGWLLTTGEVLSDERLQQFEAGALALAKSRRAEIEAKRALSPDKKRKRLPPVDLRDSLSKLMWEERKQKGCDQHE